MSSYAWMRVLTVKLTSKLTKQTLVFGNEYESNDSYKDTLDINITGYKYMSSLKDNFTIQISNLPYTTLMMIIAEQYYTVEIIAGYQNSGVMTIFKGEVVYVAQDKGDVKTHTAVIGCASELVGSSAQKRLNLSLNSGINMYSAIKYIALKADINNINVSDELKLNHLTNGYSSYSTAASYIQQLCEGTQYGINSDSSFTSDLTLWNYNNTTLRKIPLTENTIIAINGYPSLTKDGVDITCLPTFNYQCGDTIILDNSILNIATSDYDSMLTNNLGYYLDENGEYMIYQLEYSLSLRGNDFFVKMTARNTSLLSSLISDSTT